MEQGDYYYSLGKALRKEFGCPVWKVSVDAGFSCPNRDGTVGTGGCLFCSPESFSPSVQWFQGKNVSIREQIEFGIQRLKRRYVKAEKFIAYFQPSTNTYAPPEKLKRFYREALDHPDIVGLAIGTRPDALPDEVLALLAELAETAWIQLEIGLQSVHQKSLDFFRRGHTYEAFLDAMKRLAPYRYGNGSNGLRLGVHLILGIPGETREDVGVTAEAMAALPLDSIKLHNLYVVRNTRLAALWENGEIVLPTLEEYAALAVDVLERLPSNVVVERLSSEADEKDLLAPDWTSTKHAARNAVIDEFRRRNSRQGMRSLNKAPCVSKEEQQD